MSTDLIEAARSGDRLETLIALRDLLAERLATAKSDRDVASMSRRLMQAVLEIEALESRKAASQRNYLQEIRGKYKVSCKTRDASFMADKREDA